MRGTVTHAASNGPHRAPHSCSPRFRRPASRIGVWKIPQLWNLLVQAQSIILAEDQRPATPSAGNGAARSTGAKAVAGLRPGFIELEEVHHAEDTARDSRQRGPCTSRENTGRRRTSRCSFPAPHSPTRGCADTTVTPSPLSAGILRYAHQRRAYLPLSRRSTCPGPSGRQPATGPAAP